MILVIYFVGVLSIAGTLTFQAHRKKDHAQLAKSNVDHSANKNTNKNCLKNDENDGGIFIFKF